jgi:hypothetical protein
MNRLGAFSEATGEYLDGREADDGFNARPPARVFLAASGARKINQPYRPTVTVTLPPVIVLAIIALA